MKYNANGLTILFLLFTTLLLSGCVSVKQQQQKSAKSKGDLQVTLQQYKQSHFKQVEAKFFTSRSKALVFRVLSDIKGTPRWFERVQSLQVLQVYNNHQYLLRTVINSPWPFKDREVITCVDTLFKENITTINITSCSDRVPTNDQYVRLVQVESRWTIQKISNSIVEVNYKTWLDPNGYVPAFIFNRELIAGTEADLNKLQTIIDNASLDTYAY
ncbi:hypothetical protein E2R68_00470 [Psychromonas sp. RZ22]|uniref:hypothetical protein n=1 Tax=Psychromonas algarum TaxID=2555643 RepID=UPI001068818F|nr:hypothetical protein [Psychromonas sp. RZ22]TEW56545.1 hypothetical protein E2R68_00470 [Psychromonas sp. RZ22]